MLPLNAMRTVAPAGKFKSCQPEAAFNLVMHVQASLDAARSDPDPVVFTRAVEQLSTKFSSFGKNFYVSMHSISTSVCVANGYRTSNIGKQPICGERVARKVQRGSSHETRPLGLARVAERLCTAIRLWRIPRS